MKVNIRFLRQGLVSVNAPKNIDTMSAKELKEWAGNILGEMTDKELLAAMADFENPEKEGYFDESPQMSAIERLSGDPIITTDEWEMFAYGTGIHPVRVSSDNEISPNVDIEAPPLRVVTESYKPSKEKG